MYEIELDDGAVKINGTPIGDRLIVFEHSSCSLTIKLGSWYTSTPICFDISDERSMIERHGPDERFDIWIRSGRQKANRVKKERERGEGEEEKETTKTKKKRAEEEK